MTTSVKKGIVDPWRVVAPLVAPKQAPRVATQTKPKINLENIDWDSDLRTPGSHIFRSAGAGIQVTSKQIDTGADALRDLVQCLFQILELFEGPDLLEEAGIGLELHDREWLVPAAGVAASKLETPAAYTPRTVLYFIQQPYDHGMTRLVRLLNRVRKRPGNDGEYIVKRWGVETILR